MSTEHHPSIIHLDRAAAALGSFSTLAAAIGVSASAPSMWKARIKAGTGEVPGEVCPAIERATREKAAEVGDPSLIVTCEELRPDIAWSVVRANEPKAAPVAAAAGAA